MTCVSEDVSRYCSINIDSLDNLNVQRHSSTILRNNVSRLSERSGRDKDCVQNTYLLARPLSAYQSYGQELLGACPNSFSDRIVASQPQSLRRPELAFAQILGELRICVPPCGSASRCKDLAIEGRCRSGGRFAPSSLLLRLFLAKLSHYWPY